MINQPKGSCLVLAWCVVGLVFAPVLAGDELKVMVDGAERELVGDILIEAQDQSLYFRGRDGRIWFLQPEQILSKKESPEDVDPISQEELGNQLLAELPLGFRIYQTKHYVIAYQTELEYARWVGGLYESRLYRGFETFWKRRKKMELEEPKYPLVAIIFGSQAEYQQYVDRELGPGQDMVAYYNLQTNRVTMYDLTAANRVVGQPLTDRKIEQIVQSPAAIPMVATIIHEATHQLIFNRGLQTRFADTPLWLNEGMAMYFEAPDLNSKRGWQKPGLVFHQRLARFRQALRARDAAQLPKLIATDERFQDPDQSLDAYAEAWALTHFLIHRKSDEFVAYLEHMSNKPPLRTDTPETRLAEFKEYFGEDLAELDEELAKYTQRLR